MAFSGSILSGPPTGGSRPRLNNARARYSIFGLKLAREQVSESLVGQARYCPNCNRKFVDLEVCPDDQSLLLSELPDRWVGETLAGRYQVEALLGEGGMGVVYRGRHLLMKKPVAIKMLHPREIGDNETFMRFQQEAQAASRLSHQNVVAIHDFGLTPDNVPYIVMDLLSGTNLSDYLDEHVRLTPDMALKVFADICDGLQHAHDHGILHRDLKCSNVMLVKQPNGQIQAKILDFGLAKIVIGEESPNLTPAGYVVGTFIYISPEQCLGKPPTLQSDIYSLGVLMHEALTGLPPLAGDNMMETIQKHLHEEPPALSTTRPDLNFPAGLEQIILRALAKNPDDRYQSAAEVKQALQQLGHPCLNQSASQLLPGPEVKSEPQSKAIEPKSPAQTSNTAVVTEETSQWTGSNADQALDKIAEQVRASKRRASQAAVACILAAIALIVTLVQMRQTKSIPAHAEVATQAIESKNYAQAERELQLAANQYEQSADKQKLFETLHKLSDVLYLDRKIAQAKEVDDKIALLRKQDSGLVPPSAPAADKDAVKIQNYPDPHTTRLARLASVCHKNGQCDTAVDILKRSVEVSKQVYGPDSLQTAERMTELASFYMGLGASDKADDLIQAAMEIRAKNGRK